MDMRVAKDEGAMVKRLKDIIAEMMNLEGLDEETIGMVKLTVVIRISTKHINLWMRQLEMKRKELGSLKGC